MQKYNHENSQNLGFGVHREPTHRVLTGCTKHCHQKGILPPLRFADANSDFNSVAQKCFLLLLLKTCGHLGC